MNLEMINIEQMSFVCLYTSCLEIWLWRLFMVLLHHDDGIESGIFWAGVTLEIQPDISQHCILSLSHWRLQQVAVEEWSLAHYSLNTLSKVLISTMIISLHICMSINILILPSIYNAIAEGENFP